MYIIFFSLAHLIDLLERYTFRVRVGCYFLFITITINAVFPQNGRYIRVCYIILHLIRYATKQQYRCGSDNGICYEVKINHCSVIIYSSNFVYQLLKWENILVVTDMCDFFFRNKIFKLFDYKLLWVDYTVAVIDFLNDRILFLSDGIFMQYNI